MVSAACHGEICWCGAPAVKKVGEEILFDDPNPARHNLTRYICGPHYAQLMGPLGAKQVGVEAVRPPVGEEVVARAIVAVRAKDVDKEMFPGVHQQILDDWQSVLPEARAAILAMQSNG
jgi:hypothetical protein